MRAFLLLLVLSFSALAQSPITPATGKFPALIIQPTVGTRQRAEPGSFYRKTMTVEAKMTIEATRYLCWRACHGVAFQSPGADELAIEAKVYGSETAVRVLTDLMRVVGVESYDHALPLGRLLQDALALPIFGGGNIGVRRRQLHAILKRPEYDPLMASSEAEI